MSATAGNLVRRPLASRDTAWAQACAGVLARAGVRPNTVSLASVGFAAIGAAALAAGPQLDRWAGCAAFALAAAAIQLRLLCNLLDGMLAVEHGLRSGDGDVYNELPDRAADVLLLVGAGYSASALGTGAWPGWLAALLAVLTAYVRTLGGSLGLAQDFTGPLAKPQRMFVLTLAAGAAALECGWGRQPRAILAGLTIVILGTAVTLGRRTLRLAARARQR